MPINGKTSTLEMTNEERLLNLQTIRKAREHGDIETEQRHRKYIPVEPSIAFIIKKYDGINELKKWIDEGYDFSLVVREYGEEWLHSEVI